MQLRKVSKSMADLRAAGMSLFDNEAREIVEWSVLVYLRSTAIPILLCSACMHATT